MSGFLSGFMSIVKAFTTAVALAKAVWAMWKQIQYDGRKKDFQEGTVERDQTKIEESFDSDKAGKPSGHGTIVGPND